MAQNDTISVPFATWTQLTDADAATVTFQNLGPLNAFILATADATPPSSLDGALKYRSGSGEVNQALAELFPGISSPVRLWAFAQGAIAVSISHA